MDAKIEEFNWNLRCFLDTIKSYQNETNAGNDLSLKLMGKTREAITEVLANIELVQTKGADEMIMCSMDSTHFEVCRTIHCLRCQVTFPASRREYMLHSANDRHHVKIIEHANKQKKTFGNASDSNNNKNGASNEKVQSNNIENDVSLAKPLMVMDKSKLIEEKQLAIARLVDSYKLASNPIPNLTPNPSDQPAAKTLPRKTEKDTRKGSVAIIPNVFDDNIYDFLESRRKDHDTKVEEKPEPLKNNDDKRTWRQKFPESKPIIVENWREKPSELVHDQKIKKPHDIPKSKVNSLESMYNQFPHLNPDKVKEALQTVTMPKTNIDSTLEQTMECPQERMGLEQLIGSMGLKKATNPTQMPQHPNPISPPNKNINLDPNKFPVNPLIGNPLVYPHMGMNVYPHIFPSSAFQNPVLPQNYPSQWPIQPPPWNHFPVQPKSSMQNKQQTNLPMNNVRSTLKKNNLSNSMTSLPATAQQPTKPSSSKSLGKASSAMSLNAAVKKGDAKDTKSPMSKANPSSMTEFFAKDLVARMNYITNGNSTFAQQKIGEGIFESLKRLLNGKFKSLKCYLMGSYAYGTALEDSPIDIYLDLNNSFYDDKSGDKIVADMNNVVKVLQNTDKWADVKCSEQSRRGIVSAKYVKLGQRCHFRFGTGVVVRNSDVIKSLLNAQPVCRQFIICVRLLMAEMQKSNEKWLRLFNGYIITLLAIFYFQTEKKLPAIHKLQLGAKRQQCGENTVSFNEPKDVEICKDRLRDLLLGFFEFYSKFQYDQKIISPFEGRAIDHNFRKCDEKSLADTLARFRKLVLSTSRQWLSNTLCVQDIFEHKNNVTSAIGADAIKSFKCFCTKAVNALHANGTAVKY